MRRLLIEAAWQGIRRSGTIRAFFERVKRDDPDRKKIALVATGHWLVRVMAAMLRSGECWRETKAPEPGTVMEERRPGGRRLSVSPPEDTDARKPVSSDVELSLGHQ